MNEILRKKIEAFVQAAFEYADLEARAQVDENLYRQILTKGAKLAQEWISVKDSLPPEGAEALTITADGWFRILSVQFGKFPSHVTHWQNLPPAP
jgi:hypothetical protein